MGKERGAREREVGRESHRLDLSTLTIQEAADLFNFFCFQVLFLCVCAPILEVYVG